MSAALLIWHADSLSLLKPKRGFQKKAVDVDDD